ncbi:DNA-binding transcriptional response regulator, NtrC family, contains REC, AAA-type ATPase, and a Fis-type DNA-binding domains [Desulfonauticus submarinus]|uniref:DNA-binding transcriptional response regulator, NtrC family, contains REC, AAA-type ATPase, and a Fis-type DNA-binding domains n=1 Tax=Desulfonauticus submarinus TaxID=206665 RepID=A0A1H0CGU1_9BACT|nr:sigma-54 dependent transcriptional regulator [Desulfonauticus submarinus]SDN57072.1 DNA-binding transcriptional response regulator, NtrC family, contains REC, AAA-type ATPase, and a Fis-type DNA-binding domains [Desulfonauticus submarinus]
MLPKIAILDDDKIFCKRVTKIIQSKFSIQTDVFYNGADFLAKLEKRDYDLLFLDLGLPDINGFKILEYLTRLQKSIEIVIVTGDSTIDNAVKAIKQGACDYLVKPVSKNRLELTVGSLLEKIKLKQENAFLKQIVANRSQNNFIATCPKMVEILDMVKKIAPLNCNVLLQGETGTGKEMIAHMIHELSTREKGPFVAINCGAFTEDLIANELFGHDKEAFTGASSSKKGLLEAAHKGTVFLDEIGDMPLKLQVKLLKVIEERRIYRLGSTKPIDLDIRIIAATNKDLRKLVDDNRFREDLFFRLNVVTLHLPRLSERKEDLKPLIFHFITKYNTKFGKNIKRLSEEAYTILLNYDFPGNVRELENIIQRAVALADGDEIKAKHLPSDLTLVNLDKIDSDVLLSLEEVEKKHIKKVLEFTGYDKKTAAAILGLPKTTLWRRIKKFNLKSS